MQIFSSVFIHYLAQMNYVSIVIVSCCYHFIPDAKQLKQTTYSNIVKAARFVEDHANE
jgi:hypothetical protein